MVEPVTPSEGWGCLHLFCAVGDDVDRQAVLAAVKSAQEDEHQVVPFAVLGHKADLGFMVVGPDLWRLQQFQSEVRQAGLEFVDSYVSLTEVSEYSKGMPEELLDARLHPHLPPPGKTAICFYPMSKKREGDANWYTLPFEQRKELMFGHGKVGREFAGRILQLITGSTGIDDYEWGVTLFAEDPVDLKECVYRMRFDEGSAVYAEFGPFITGLVGLPEEVLDRVGLT
ncbi:MAG: chlorite dismutase family protein [Acidimicrobiia bacterium]|nr:chlorite dismutase family protein [Acidimicrobiia bacterium]